jgi:hypothetical protein
MTCDRVAEERRVVVGELTPAGRGGWHAVRGSIRRPTSAGKATMNDAEVVSRRRCGRRRPAHGAPSARFHRPTCRCEVDGATPPSAGTDAVADGFAIGGRGARAGLTAATTSAQSVVGRMTDVRGR